MRRGISAAFASKLMADFVADAIKVENPRATASAGALCLRQALRPIERVRVLPSTIIPPGKSASRPKTEGPPRKAARLLVFGTARRRAAGRGFRSLTCVGREQAI